MIAVWLHKRRVGRKTHYLMRWQVREMDPAGQPVRYPNGRAKMRAYQERCNTTDGRTAEAMRAKRQRLLNGLDVPPEPARHVSLDELAKLEEGWLRNRGRAEGTIYLAKLVLSQLRDILQRCGRPAMADTITPQDVELFISERRKDVSARSVNHGLGALRATFNRAVKHDVLRCNPFAKLDRLEEMHKPIQPLTQAEEQSLLAACARDLELNAFVRLALDSGARAGELCNLRVGDLDLDKGLARIECGADWQSKTRRNRPIAFTAATGDVLRLWLMARLGRTYVFRDEVEKQRTTYRRLFDEFKAAVKRAGIGRKVTPHDLRRTVGSLLAERGVNQRVAMEYLGHTNIGTTARYYQAVRPDTLRAVVARLRPTGTGE